jgi:peptidoglycan biosynthesis protein MviN/MurJ (putative lipid II flippase)
MNKFIHRIANALSNSNRNIGKIGFFLLINGMLALVKNILTVQIFGISKEIEIYFAAMIAMVTIERLFNVGTLNEILIPSYIRLKEKENNYIAMTSFSLINNWVFLIACFATIGLWFIAPFFLSVILPGFSKQDLHQTTVLFRVIALFIPFRMFNGMCSVPFMANKIYTMHEITGMINKLIVIMLLIFANEIYGTKVLILGMILGIIIRFFYILFLFRRFGFCYQFLLKSDRFTAKWILKKIYIPLIQTLFLQFNRWILLGALTVLPQGLLAIYQYIQQFYGQFSSIIMKSMGTVFLTETSTKTKIYNKDWLSVFLKKNSLIYFFSALMVVCIGKDFLKLIWESDKFSANDVSTAYILLVFLVFTMFFEMLRSIYLKLDTVRGNIAQQYFSSIIILTISSIILLLTVKIAGFYALIFRVLFITITQALFSVYINYYKSKDAFVIYSKTHIVKALSQGVAVLIIIKIIFDSLWFNIELSRMALLCSVCVKALVVTMIFMTINKYLKVHDLRLIIKS